MSYAYGNHHNSTADDEDLYEGFNYSIDLAPPQTASSKPMSSYGGANGNNPPGSSYRAPPSQMAGAARSLNSRMGTGVAGASDARPMTSVSGAGFSSTPATAATQLFDPLGESKKGPAPALAKKKENSPEEQARAMELEVHELIERSAECHVQGDFPEALDLAKDAGKKERQLSKFRNANQIDNVQELTYGVLFNLANAYHANDMTSEALNSYTLIVKNKNFSQGSRLRVNMGNIYYGQAKYPSAIKMYRMALDQIPSSNKQVRFKIMRNIGNAFVKMGQFADAIQSFEEIIDAGTEDFQVGFNLLVCYYALGDAEKMKKGFSKLASLPLEDQSASSVDGHEDDAGDASAKSLKPQQDGNELSMTSSIHDELHLELRERKKRATQYLSTAARLCAPVLDRKHWTSGFDWIIDRVTTDHPNLAGEMEMSKAVHYLKHRCFDEAIAVFKAFEKKEKPLKAMAAVNLSCLYFIEDKIDLADKYANLAVRYQRYNAKALVNKGNCLFCQGELERAKELYLEAIGVEADCTEAIYNLGLVNKRMHLFQDALQAFEKLHSILPGNVEVLYQVANVFDLMSNSRESAKWFNLLLTCFGSNVADPGVLSRLGQIFNKDDDETQAFHYHLESYRLFPVNLDVISWLGVWYVKSELYEKSIQFFERAAQIQPGEVKWRLMVTSCYRRMGNYAKALSHYEKIHHDYPENLECLRYLVAICKDLGHSYENYQHQLLKLERSSDSRGPPTTGALTRMQPDTPGRSLGSHHHHNDNNNEANGGYLVSHEQDEMKEPESYANHHHLSSSSRASPPKNLTSTGYEDKPSGSSSSDSPLKTTSTTKYDHDQSDDWGDADVGDLLVD